MKQTPSLQLFLVLTNFYLGNANALDGKHPLNHFFDYDLGVHQMLIDFYKSVLGETTVPGEVIARLAKHSKEPNETFKGDGSVDYQIKSAILIPTYAQLLKKITESKWEK